MTKRFLIIPPWRDPPLADKILDPAKRDGSGVMGEVYLAEDTSLDRNVALKFLPSDVGGSRTAPTEGYERFNKEAKAAAKLNHPNIITVYEIGEQKNTTFIDMKTWR